MSSYSLLLYLLIDLYDTYVKIKNRKLIKHLISRNYTTAIFTQPYNKVIQVRNI